MGVKERREREFTRRERAILDAALRLLDGDDWLSVTIEQIADHAEVGKGTVYKHFASKEELYARLSLDHCSDHLRAVEGVDPTLPLDQRLRAMVQVYWDVHIQPGICHHVVEYCEADTFRRRLPEDMRLEFEAIESVIYQRFFATIQEGMEAGLFPSAPVPPLAMIARATLDGTIRLIRFGVLSAEDERAHLDAVTRFIMAGLAGTEGPRPGS